MKRIPATAGLAMLILAVLTLGAAPVWACSPDCFNKKSYPVNRPAPNPYLASSLYGIVHFDSSASDSTPYGPPKGAFLVDPEKEKISYGGPGNLMTLASTNPDYMWQPSTDRVQYIYKKGKQWIPVAKLDLLDLISNGTYPAVSDETLQAFGEAPAAGMTPSDMDAYLKSLFGDNYAGRMGNGVYTLVSSENVLYANYNGVILGIALKNPRRPEAGIEIRYRLDDPVLKIQGTTGARAMGLSMTYDGHIIVTFTNGVAVIDRQLTLKTKSFYPFAAGERVSNSLCVDEKNGIYIVSNTVMRKLVWTGKTISDKATDGAWSSTYSTSTEVAPIARFDNGSGSSPTLMGFGKDKDKLVIITDGNKQMNLVAFWRDKIPAGFTERIAGTIPVTCGYTTLPEWIQSEQSVVVHGYGAFVVNNIPESVEPALKAAPNNFIKIGLMGPAYPGPHGVERFQWDTRTHSWESAWGRPDVSSPSMIPLHSDSGNMAVVGGYIPDLGWVVQGLDWDTGDTVHLTILGPENYGNGYYAILQFLENGDLLFNGFAGAIRVHYNDWWDRYHKWHNRYDPWHR